VSLLKLLISSTSIHSVGLVKGLLRLPPGLARLNTAAQEDLALKLAKKLLEAAESGLFSDPDSDLGNCVAETALLLLGNRRKPPSPPYHTILPHILVSGNVPARCKQPDPELSMAWRRRGA
jgi:hypothetical protein